MAVIGVIDIAMRATTEKFTRGINVAANSLDRFVESVKPAATELFNIGAMAAGAAVAGLTALATVQFKAANETGELAVRLGVGAEALQAFQYAIQFTDGPVEELGMILGKLRGTLGDAAKSATPASMALTQLGLDAKRLASMDTVNAFKMIRDRLAELGPTTQQASLASDLFGKKSVDLGNVLNATADEIANLEEEAKRRGIILSDAEIGSIMRADDALQKVGAQVGALGKRIAADLSPFILAASDQFVDLVKKSGGFGPMVASGFGQVQGAIGWVLDKLQEFSQQFKGIQSLVTSGLAAMAKGLALFAKGLQALANMLPGVKLTFGDTLDAVAKGLGDLAKDQLKDFRDQMKAPLASEQLAQGINKITDGAKAMANAADGAAKSAGGMGNVLTDNQKSVADLTKKLEEQVATHGMDANAIAVYKLAQEGASEADVDRMVALLKQGDALDASAKAQKDLNEGVAGLEKKLLEQVATTGLSANEMEVYKIAQMGATDADILRLKSLAAQADAMDASEKAQKKLVDDAKRVTEETRTAAEKTAAEKMKLEELFSKGLIDEETFKRAMMKGVESVDVTKRAGAVEAGSAEARTALLNFRQGKNTADDLSKRTAQNTAATAKGIETLVGIAQAGANMPPPVEVSI